MTATHKPFRSAALGYHNNRKYVQENTTAANPTTISKIYDALKDGVKDIQQVRDAVVWFRQRGEFTAIREGRELAIWWRENNGLKPVTIINDDVENTPEPQVTVTETKVTKSEILAAPTKDVNMPEVQITKNTINILAGGVRISIERY